MSTTNSPKEAPASLKTSDSIDNNDIGGKQPLLPCVVFLHAQHQNGSIDVKTFHILRRMIRITSAIGWETHNIVENKTCPSHGASTITWYGECLLAGCKVFIESMKSNKARTYEALSVLPALDGSSGEKLRGKMVKWKAKLRTLHDPTGNGVKLFRLISEHYNIHAYRRLLRLQALRGDAVLDLAGARCKAVFRALEELCELAQEADGLVQYLRDKYEAAVTYVNRTAQSLANAEMYGVESVFDSSPESESVTSSDVSLPRSRMSPGPTIPSLSKSFAVVESELAQRRHHRAATFAGSDYTTRDSIIAASQEKLRRVATDIPRVFTGSFSQLENDIRRLQLHRINTPEARDGMVDDGQEVKVLDFATATIDSDPFHETSGSVTELDTEQSSSPSTFGSSDGDAPANAIRLPELEEDDVLNMPGRGLNAWLDQTPRQRGRNVTYPPGSTVKHSKRERTL